MAPPYVWDRATSIVPLFLSCGRGSGDSADAPAQCIWRLDVRHCQKSIFINRLKSLWQATAQGMTGRMDDATLNAYNRDSSGFASDWETQPPPTDLHATVKKFFIPGGATADIGCGSGRDAAWLDANGYPATGFDASDGLLAEARKRHPQVQFATAVLPELAGIADGSFTNVLCETVIMHLGPEAITPAVERLLSILVPEGVLYLSWRVTEGADRRDEHGRLYAAFEPDRVLNALATTDVLLDEQVGSVSSGKLIRRIVVRKQKREN